MKYIETSIIVEAPVTKVWEVLMDFAAYPNWNPFIKKITGIPSVGETLEVAIQPPGQSVMTFRPIVVRSEVQDEFRWKGKLFIKGLFDGEHYFRLVSLEPEQTKLVHGENFKGLLSGLIFTKIGTSTQQGFDAMNKALKERIESSA